MSSFAERLIEARTKCGMSQRELARIAGLTGATLSNWETGVASPTSIRAAALETVAGALGVSARWLLTGKADEPRGEVPDGLLRAAEDVRNIPVVSMVRAGLGAEAVDSYARGDGNTFVTVGADLAPTLSRLTFALEIQGDSMADEFRPGDIVIIDPSVRPLPGDYVVARLDSDQSATFKKYRARGNETNGMPIFELVPSNPDYPTVTVNADNPGRVIGTMIEHRRRRRR